MKILDQLDKYPKDLISKGYSEEIKYKVKADKNYFLKISPLSFAKKKDLELKYISDLEKVIKFPNLIEIKYESDSILSLYEWINGVDFREYVTQLTDKELYQFGIQAGEFLKKIHSISIEEYSYNWEEYYIKKSMKKIDSFRKVNIKFLKLKLLLIILLLISIYYRIDQFHYVTGIFMLGI